MRASFFIALFGALVSPVTVNAAIIATLFNTGVGNDGTLLSDGSVDPHYHLVVNPDGTGSQSYVVQQGVFPLYPIHYWFADNSNSKWIAPQPDYGSLLGDVPNSTFTWETSFSLAGYDASTARVSVAWATDNNGVDVLLNGASMDQTTSFISAYVGFSMFTIDQGFLPGRNTLDFVVQNGPDGNPPPFTGNPTGLRVELSGTAAVVPEPSAIVTWFTGALSFAYFLCRRKCSLAKPIVSAFAAVGCWF